jgi:hypothetical protein
MPPSELCIPAPTMHCEPTLFREQPGQVRTADATEFEATGPAFCNGVLTEDATFEGMPDTLSTTGVRTADKSIRRDLKMRSYRKPSRAAYRWRMRAIPALLQDRATLCDPLDQNLAAEAEALDNAIVAAASFDGASRRYRTSGGDSGPSRCRKPGDVVQARRN